MKPPGRKRFQKAVRRLEYRDAANLLRELIEERYPDPRALRILAEHAWSIAPDDATAEIMLKMHRVFAAGRVIKFSTGRVTEVDGVPVDLIDEINSIEQGEQT